MLVNVSTEVVPGHPLRLFVVFKLIFRACKTGESLENEICATCPMGTYSLRQDSSNWEDTVCEICPENAACSNGAISVDAGYWRSNYLSATPQPCFFDNACAGGKISNYTINSNPWANTDEQCAEGNRGPRCGACADGWYRSGGGVTCKLCKSSGDAAIAFLIVVPVLLIIIVILGLYKLGAETHSKPVTVSVEDMVPASNPGPSDLEMSAIYNSPQDLSSLNPDDSTENEIKSTVPKSSLKRVRSFMKSANENAKGVMVSFASLRKTLVPKAKIVLTLFQIISGLPQVLILPFPKVFNKIIDGMRYFSEFLSPKGNSLKCGSQKLQTSYFDNLLLDTLLPIVLSLVIFVMYQCHKFFVSCSLCGHKLGDKKKRVVSESVAFKKWNAVIPPRPLSQPQAQTNEQAQDIREDGDAKTNDDDEVKDNREKVRQRGAQFRRLRRMYLFLFMLLTFIILPGVSVCIFDAFTCFDIDDADGTLKDIGLPTRFLRADVNIDCDSNYYLVAKTWAIAMIFVYPIGIPLFYLYILYINRRAIRARNVYDDDADQIISNEDSELDDNPHNNKLFISHNEIKFLFKNYKPQYWYWEVVETSRRLLLTGVLAVIQAGTFYQIVSGILFSLVFLTLQAHFQPFLNENDDTVQEFAQLQVLLTLIGALLLKGKAFATTPGGDAPLGASLVFISFGTLALIFHYALLELQPRYAELRNTTMLRMHELKKRLLAFLIRESELTRKMQGKSNASTQPTENNANSKEALSTSVEMVEMLKAELENEKKRRLTETASIESIALSERLEKEAIKRELMGLRKRLTSQQQPVAVEGGGGEMNNPMRTAKL